MEDHLYGSLIEPEGASEQALLPVQLHPLYTVTSEVSTDPAGVLYRAVYEGEGRKVLVKALSPGLSADASYLKEAPAGTLKLIDTVTGVNKNTLLVLQHPDTSSLKRVLAHRGVMPAWPSAAVTVEVLRVLRRLHEQGRVFGNLNPGGLFPDRSPFGDLTIHMAYLGLPETAVPLNSAGYRPPEADEPGHRPSVDDDLWAAAAILYEMLFGLLPIASETSEVSRDQSLFIPSDFAEAYISIAEVLQRALHPKPSERFSSAEALSDALTEEMNLGAPRSSDSPRDRNSNEGASPSRTTLRGRASVSTIPSPPTAALVRRSLMPAPNSDAPPVHAVYSIDPSVRPEAITAPPKRKRRGSMPRIVAVAWVVAASALSVAAISVWALLRERAAIRQQADSVEWSGDAESPIASPSPSSASAAMGITVEMTPGQLLGGEENKDGRDSEGVKSSSEENDVGAAQQDGVDSQALKKRKHNKAKRRKTNDLSPNPF